jgi:hypothetical protein
VYNVEICGVNKIERGLACCMLRYGCSRCTFYAWPLVHPHNLTQVSMIIQHQAPIVFSQQAGFAKARWPPAYCSVNPVQYSVAILRTWLLLKCSWYELE